MFIGQPKKKYICQQVEVGGTSRRAWPNEICLDVCAFYSLRFNNSVICESLGNPHVEYNLLQALIVSSIKFNISLLLGEEYYFFKLLVSCLFTVLISDCQSFPV